MSLTFSGQHSDADPWVTELNEGQVLRLLVLLSDQENVLGANISMSDVFIFLFKDTMETSAEVQTNRRVALVLVNVLPNNASPRLTASPPLTSRGR